MVGWRSGQGRALYFTEVPSTSPSASTPPLSPALCPGRLTITVLTPGSNWVQTMVNVPGGERAGGERDWDASVLWTPLWLCFDLVGSLDKE